MIPSRPCYYYLLVSLCPTRAAAPADGHETDSEHGSKLAQRLPVWARTRLPFFCADPSDTRAGITPGGGSGANEISMAALCLSGSVCEIRRHYILRWKHSTKKQWISFFIYLYMVNTILCGGNQSLSVLFWKTNSTHIYFHIKIL